MSNYKDMTIIFSIYGKKTDLSDKVGQKDIVRQIRQMTKDYDEDIKTVRRLRHNTYIIRLINEEIKEKIINDLNNYLTKILIEKFNEKEIEKVLEIFKNLPIGFFTKENIKKIRPEILDYLI